MLPHIRGRLLDVGCGTNELVKAYGGGVGADVYQWGSVDLVVEDSARLPVASGSFDTVTIIAALNHIPNRVEVLSEAHRVLKADGRIILTMVPPAISRIWHAVRQPWDADQHERGMKEGEVCGMTMTEIRRLLHVAGFRVLLEERFMFGINRLTVAAKTAGERQ